MSAQTFAPLRHLAERGSLPSVLITFTDDGGIEFGAEPDGDVMWHNTRNRLVPIHAARQPYALSALQGPATAKRATAQTIQRLAV